ncbi:MAG: S1 RNA-binding domain-containing protein [bacterium]|nr:S1 RNA-binding domain-containing protein [bacterium]MDD6225641.1 S1 RNA-binding domain-containing protein [bacterium]MDY3861036.1 S1 RNA-binding domain-containing protein [Ruminococcus sp.]
MSLEVGSILEGKVSGVTKFGAFVTLPGGETGMVHISEIAPTFVNEISDFVKLGDTVKVKVLSLGDGKKISLSIKQTMEPSENPKKSAKQFNKPPRQRKPYTPAPPVTSPGDFEWQSSRREAPQSFEDMMSRFKQTSEDKMSDLKRTGESRGYSRRGGSGRK